jgi:Mrp family chromosome partitioning ATPase
MGRMLNALRQIDAKFSVGFPEGPAATPAKPQAVQAKPQAAENRAAEAFMAEMVGPPRWEVSEISLECPPSAGSLSAQTPAVLVGHLPARDEAPAGEGARADRGVEAFPATGRLDGRYYELAANIAALLPPGRPAALAFISPGTIEGMTGVVASLGVAMARRSEGGVLLIEANFRAPALAKRMGVEESLGLADVLRGDAHASRAVKPTAVGGVSLLSAGHIGLDDDCLPDIGQLPEILAQLRCEYQTVLIDAGPLSQPEVPRLARFCDGAYLVIRLGATPRREVSRSIELVKRYGSRVLGCVLVEN